MRTKWIFLYYIIVAVGVGVCVTVISGFGISHASGSGGSDQEGEDENLQQVNKNCYVGFERTTNNAFDQLGSSKAVPHLHVDDILFVLNKEQLMHNRKFSASFILLHRVRSTYYMLSLHILMTAVTYGDVRTYNHIFLKDRFHLL